MLLKQIKMIPFRKILPAEDAILEAQFFESGIKV
jgi:hypothetical protein